MPQARIRDHRIHYRVSEDLAIIRPEDACDESATEALALLVNSTLVSSRNVIIDFSHCAYVETPGFRWLVRQYRHLQSDGRSMVVASLPPTAERAFRALRLDAIIPSTRGVSEAFDRLRGCEERFG